MAVTDWTRTDLDWPLKNGGTALRFDAVDLAAYDLFILERAGAETDHSPDTIAAAEARFGTMAPETKERLERNLIDWLPARDFIYDRDSFKRALATYAKVDVEEMRAHLIALVREFPPSPRRKAQNSPFIPTIRPSRSSVCPA